MPARCAARPPSERRRCWPRPRMPGGNPKNLRWATVPVAHSSQARPCPYPQAQRGQETYPRSHSKQATDRARPPHSPCEVPSAHRASRSRSRDCGAMRGREQGRARGTQTGAPARREPHKTPFLPTRPAFFPAVLGPCCPRGGLCAVTGPAAFSARVPGDSGQSEDKRSRTRFRGREPRTCRGEGRRGGEGAMEGAVDTQDGELEHGRDLVTGRRTGSNLVAQRMEGRWELCPGKEGTAG